MFAVSSDIWSKALLKSRQCLAWKAANRLVVQCEMMRKRCETERREGQCLQYHSSSRSKTYKEQASE